MRLFVWLAVAWLTPAVIAGALGWRGVWGSGSALGDYLSPLPISGGFMHLPSLATVTLLLATQPWRAPFAGWLRGILLTTSLLGASMLLDLNALYVAATTDAASRALPWQEHPLGLFLLCDGVLAQGFAGAFRGESPRGAWQWTLSLGLACGVALGFAWLDLRSDPRHAQPFVVLGSRGGAVPGDEMHFVFTRLPVDGGGFRGAAEDFAQRFDPRLDVNSEDVAVLLFSSGQAAESAQAAQALATYCMYEDGTVPRWLPGAGDCFADHESFRERLTRTHAALPRTLHPDLRAYLARVEACREFDPIVMPRGMYDDNSATRACRDLDKAREELLRKHGRDPAVAGRIDS